MITLNVIHEACAALGLTVKGMKSEVHEDGRTRMTLSLWWPSGGTWDFITDWHLHTEKGHEQLLEMLEANKGYLVPQEPGDTPIRGDT